MDGNIIEGTVSATETGLAESRQGELALDRPHETNPFLKGFTVPMRHKKTGVSVDPLATINLRTGELGEAAEVVKRVAVDAERFLKVFRAQMTLFFELSAPGIKVLTAVWMATSDDAEGRAQIYLSERIAADYAKRSGSELSRATYFRGRKELIERGIIAPGRETNLYWLNPTVFFNGDRLRLVLELMKKPEIAAPGRDFE